MQSGALQYLFVCLSAKLLHARDIIQNSNAVCPANEPYDLVAKSFIAGS